MQNTTAYWHHIHYTTKYDCSKLCIFHQGKEAALTTGIILRKFYPFLIFQPSLVTEIVWSHLTNYYRHYSLFCYLYKKAGFNTSFLWYKTTKRSILVTSTIRNYIAFWFLCFVLYIFLVVSLGKNHFNMIET